MGIQINGQNDTISAGDGSLTVSGANLPTVSNLVVSGSSPNELVRITQTGVGPALLVEDDTNPDSTPFAIRADGNVGIGTTNPTARLTLFSGAPQIDFNKSNAPTDSKRILLSKTNDELYIQSLTDAGAGGGNLFSFYHVNQQVTQFRAYQSGIPWFVVDNDNARVTVTTGSVGIGSTTPNAKFQVLAPSTTAPSLSWGASSGQIFTNEDSEFAFGLANQAPYPLYIQGRQKTGTARDIALNPLGGNIGIGLTNPDTTLDIRPSSNIAQLKLTQSNVSGGGDGWKFHADGPNGGHLFVKREISNVDSTPITILSDGNIRLTPNSTISNLSNVNIGTSAGIASTAFQINFVNGNTGFIKVQVRRNSTGGDWTTSSTRLLHQIDATEQGYIEYNPPGQIYGMAFGQGTVEWARFNSDGRLLVGHTTSIAAAYSGQSVFQVSTNGFYAGSFNHYGNDAFPAIIQLTKSRGTGKVTQVAVIKDDSVGDIRFEGTDGTNYHSCAGIVGVVDGIVGVNSMPGRLVFVTTSSSATIPLERARITSGGYFKAGNTGTYHNSTGLYHEFRQTLNDASLAVTASDSSYTANMIHGSSVRSNSNLFNLLVLETGTFTDREFVLRGDGNAFADGTWTGGGADYAEYFEWSDGNPNEEDRRGYSVILDGDKIVIAEEGEDPIGVISGNPSIVGDAAWNKWSGKYLRDDFGTYIMETHQVVEWEEQILESEEVPAVYGEDGEMTQPEIPAKYKTVPHSYEDWNIPSGIVVPDDATYKSVDENGKPFTHRKLNPDYDPDQEYTPREQRPEWDCVGLMGKLRIRKGQPVGSRWIKMRDISDTVEEWLVR